MIIMILISLKKLVLHYIIYNDVTDNNQVVSPIGTNLLGLDIIYVMIGQKG